MRGYLPIRYWRCDADSDTANHPAAHTGTGAPSTDPPSQPAPHEPSQTGQAVQRRGETGCRGVGPVAAAPRHAFGIPSHALHGVTSTTCTVALRPIPTSVDSREGRFSPRPVAVHTRPRNPRHTHTPLSLS